MRQVTNWVLVLVSSLQSALATPGRLSECLSAIFDALTDTRATRRVVAHTATLALERAIALAREQGKALGGSVMRVLVRVGYNTERHLFSHELDR